MGLAQASKLTTLIVGCTLAAWCSAEEADALARPGWQARDAAYRSRDAALARLPRVDALVVRPDGVITHFAGASGWRLPNEVPDRVLQLFAERHAGLLGTRGRPTLRHVRSYHDDDGRFHVRATQARGGLPVVGSGVLLHFDAYTGDLIGFEADLMPEADGAPPTPRLDAAQARAVATSALAGSTATAPTLVWLNVAPHRGRLVWMTDIAGEAAGQPTRTRHYIDAGTGEILSREPLILEALERRIWDAQFTTNRTQHYLCDEQIRCYDQEGISLKQNLGETYGYFGSFWGRDAIDGLGSPINGTVKYSIGFGNAFYDLTTDWMVFGNGAAGIIGPLARALDVVAHEYVHGVTKYEVDFVNLNQTLALNEHFSDAFAATVEFHRTGISTADTFKFAEEIWKAGAPGDAARYMDDPARDGYSLDWYPNYVANPNTLSHYAMGIGNLAFELLANGGTHPRRPSVVVPALGLERTARIWQRALRYHVLSSEDYTQFRAHSAAGANSPQDAAAVHLAWDAVGVPNSPNVPPAKPATLSLQTEWCYGLYDAAWTPDGSAGAAQWFELSFSTASDMSGAQALYSGPFLSSTISIPSTGFVGVKACNAHGCSANKVSNAKYYATCQ